MAPAVRAGWIIGGFLGGILALGYGSGLYALAFAALALFISPRIALFLYLGCAIGVIYCISYSSILDAYRILPEKGTYEAVIVSGPKRYADYYRFEAELQYPYRGKIYILTEKTLEYGDLASLRGKIRENSWKGLPGAGFPEIDIIAVNKGSYLGSFLNGMKASFLKPLDSGLPSGQSAFLKGLLFGDTSEFSQDFKDEMRRSGTTHLVALSGYNIALISTAIAWILGNLFSPKGMFLAAALSMSAFVFMTGAEPSALRAAIMGMMLLLAKGLGRKYSFGHAVLWTAFFLVASAPYMIFALGFQLSFVSLMGIALLPPAFQRLFRIRKMEGWAGEIATASSAYAASIPLTASLGGVSLSAIPANVAILPFIPITMFLGFVAGALSIVPFIGYVLIKTLEIILSLELGMIRIFSFGPRLEIEHVPFFAVALYYGALFLLIKHYGNEPA